MKPIILSKKAKFFIAVCKDGEHSWLTLGANEPDSGVTHTLAYYGKRLTYAKDYQCLGRMQTIFGTVPGVLTRDYKFKKALEQNAQLTFEYKAYAISRENYIEFARQMKGLLDGKYADYDAATTNYHRNQLYFPNKDNPDQFDFVDIKDVDIAQKTNIDSNVEQLGVSDNCRHTVLSLLKTFLKHGEQFAQGISTFAYQCLPYKAVYHQDQILGHFYILPTPPGHDHGDDPLYKVRVSLFKRLEKIPALKATDQATWDKFQAVKSLYESLESETDSLTSSLSDVMQKINDWEVKNAPLIDSCRLFKTNKTKTRQMVEEIKHTLAPRN